MMKSLLRKIRVEGAPVEGKAQEQDEWEHTILYTTFTKVRSVKPGRAVPFCDTCFRRPKPCWQERRGEFVKCRQRSRPAEVPLACQPCNRKQDCLEIPPCSPALSAERAAMRKTVDHLSERLSHLLSLLPVTTWSPSDETANITLSNMYQYSEGDYGEDPDGEVELPESEPFFGAELYSTLLGSNESCDECARYGKLCWSSHYNRVTCRSLTWTAPIVPRGCAGCEIASVCADTPCLINDCRVPEDFGVAMGGTVE